VFGIDCVHDKPPIGQRIDDRSVRYIECHGDRICRAYRVLFATTFDSKVRRVADRHGVDLIVVLARVGLPNPIMFHSANGEKEVDLREAHARVTGFEAVLAGADLYFLAAAQLPMRRVRESPWIAALADGSRPPKSIQGSIRVSSGTEPCTDPFDRTVLGSTPAP
jgi:hypothetical protein